MVGRVYLAATDWRQRGFHGGGSAQIGLLYPTEKLSSCVRGLPGKGQPLVVGVAELERGTNVSVINTGNACKPADDACKGKVQDFQGKEKAQRYPPIVGRRRISLRQQTPEGDGKRELL